MYKGPFGQILVVNPLSLPPPKKYSRSGQVSTTLESYHPSTSIKLHKSKKSISPLSTLISEELFGLDDHLEESEEEAILSDETAINDPASPLVPSAEPNTTNVGESTSPPISEAHPHHVRDRSSTLVASNPRPFESATTSFDFVYAEKDTQLNELNEFFSFHDFETLANGKELCLKDKDFAGEIPDLEVLQSWITGLKVTSSSQRISYGSRVLYYALGWFSSQKSVSEQLIHIQKHTQSLWEIQAFLPIYEALQHSIYAWENCTITPVLKRDIQVMVDSYDTEIRIYLALMFLMLSRVNEGQTSGNGNHSDEMLKAKQILMDVQIKLVGFLFQTLNRLTEGSRHNFPLKKLLLVLWRVLLIMVGNEDQYKRLKSCAAQQWGIPPSQVTKAKDVPKVCPQEYHNYHTLATLRHPTYFLPDVVEQLAHLNIEDSKKKELFGEVDTNTIRQVNIARQCLYRPNEQFPPPGLHPFTEGEAEFNFIPPALKEAVDLYKSNMHVSISSVQIASEKARLSDPRNRWLPEHLKPMNEPSLDTVHLQHPDPDYPLLLQVQDLHESLVKNHATNISTLMRSLYFMSVGPQTDANGNVLKVDTTRTALTNPPVTLKELEAMLERERSAELERLENMRQREIATKAISAIVFLLLRVAKLHHTLSFEYVSQLLVDNNAAMLILKMLTVWFPNTNASGPKSANVSAESPNSMTESKSKESLNSVSGVSWLKALPHIPQLNFFDFCQSQETRRTQVSSHDSLDTKAPPIPEEDEILSAASTQFSISNPSLTSSSSSSQSQPNHLISSAPTTNIPLSRRSSRQHLTHSSSTPSFQFQSPIRLLEPASFRNFFTLIQLLRVLHAITKGRKHRVFAMVQWKASNVLKRLLKINHAALFLYSLKLLKEQIPFLGKKWRANNMKAISLIYMHLRPNLTEDYLCFGAVAEQPQQRPEIDMEEALNQEREWRAFVAGFHRRRYQLEISMGEPGKETVVPRQA